MIYAVVNTKGGVGKTCIALQIGLALAFAGRRVWFIDGDKQGTMIDALTRRADTADAKSCAQFLVGATLRQQVQLSRGEYDDVVIDAGGQDSSTMRAAMTVADLALVPFKPRDFDTWALHNMADVVAEARESHDLRVLALLNEADPPNQPRDNREAREAVEAVGCFELLSVQLGRRKDLARASASGRYIGEVKGADPVAGREIAQLLHAVAPDLFPPVAVADEDQEEAAA